MTSTRDALANTVLQMDPGHPGYWTLKAVRSNVGSTHAYIKRVMRENQSIEVLKYENGPHKGTIKGFRRKNINPDGYIRFKVKKCRLQMWGFIIGCNVLVGIPYIIWG